MNSQCDRLLTRLERGPVDPMVALNEMVSVTNQFGESCRVASYRLEK